MDFPWGVDMDNVCARARVCAHMHACTHIWVTISSKYYRFSLSEGVIQTLNPSYDKEASGILGLLLT